uniref:Glucan endo-1,3-beta-D-glucosidase n=1 Tax=Ananas comosus var. bracteatus TaxID=296719 RepID=A0A6V7PV67_ANACO|nr:unnamed protein product [Ananas comosus var. bracteatus]
MFGFVRNQDEPCVYKKTSGSQLVFLVLYVDSILLIGNDTGLIAVEPGIRVVVALPNELLAAATSHPGYTLGWVQRNVAAYYPAIQIAAVAVGNEVFASPRSNLITLPVPAMTNVHATLARLGLDGSVKVSSPIALTVLRSSYPPFAGTFPTTSRSA